MAAMVGSASSLGTIDGRSLLFIILSGLATGASWLCVLRGPRAGRRIPRGPHRQAVDGPGDPPGPDPAERACDRLECCGIVVITAGTLLMVDPETFLGCRSPCAGAEVGSRTRSRPRCSPR